MQEKKEASFPKNVLRTLESSNPFPLLLWLNLIFSFLYKLLYFFSFLLQWLCLKQFRNQFNWKHSKASNSKKFRDKYKNKIMFFDKDRDYYKNIRPAPKMYWFGLLFNKWCIVHLILHIKIIGNHSAYPMFYFICFVSFLVTYMKM